MEELKLLIGMVEKLPALAIWVIVIFFVYKVVVVGSFYGIIRFIVKAVVSIVSKRREEVELRGTIDGMCITSDGTHVRLIEQLHRLKGIHLSGNFSSRQYIHAPDVEWLRDAIDKCLAERNSR